MDRKSDYFLEAHSYAGGLKFTHFSRSGGRPEWAPPADSVGWHDEFSFGQNDTIVEISKRSYRGNDVCWLAVYRRSIDSKFGDRGNHAGIGVWLLNYRVADAKELVSALHAFALTLEKQPSPDILSDPVSDFSTPRFIESYLIEGAKLPSDWVGSPGAVEALATTKYFEVVEAEFERAAHRIAGHVVRWSLGWDRANLPPRSLIRIGTAPCEDRTAQFHSIEASDTVLADIILRVPLACAASFEAERTMQHRLEQRESELTKQLSDQQFQWEEEKRRLESIDGQPVTLEAIARLLGRLSRDVAELKAVRAPAPAPVYPPMRDRPVRPNRSTSPQPNTRQEQDNFFGSEVFVWAIWGFIILMVMAIAFMLANKYLF